MACRGFRSARGYSHRRSAADGHLPFLFRFEQRDLQPQIHLLQGLQLPPKRRQLGLGQEALTLLRWNLSPAMLYDGLYFGEYDGIPEKTIEVGAHAMHLHAIQNMLLDGRAGRQVRVFPALPREWETKGVGFNRLLADGGIEVSAQFDENGSRVVLRNTGSREQVRTILLRVPSTFLGAAEAGGAPSKGSSRGASRRWRFAFPPGDRSRWPSFPPRKGSLGEH